MSKTNDRKLFVAACIERPNDRTAKLVFADWCEEHNEPLAAIALRWMTTHRKAPTRGAFPRATPWGFYGDSLDARKTKRRYFRPSMPQGECWLPDVIMYQLVCRWGRCSRDWFALVRRLGWALQRIRDLVV